MFHRAAIMTLLAHYNACFSWQTPFTVYVAVVITFIKRILASESVMSDWFACVLVCCIQNADEFHSCNWLHCIKWWSTKSAVITSHWSTPDEHVCTGAACCRRNYPRLRLVCSDILVIWIAVFMLPDCCCVLQWNVVLLPPPRRICNRRCLSVC